METPERTNIKNPKSKNPAPNGHTKPNRRQPPQRAKNSTGPNPPEGRVAVRLNGIKHGLTASDLVLEGENAADFEALFDSIQAEHQPTTPLEVAMVRRIAMATTGRQGVAAPCGYMLVIEFRPVDACASDNLDDSSLGMRFFRPGTIASVRR